MLIRARAPLRLGFAGGGTDVSPYCDTYGSNILNAAIDKYAYAVIRTLDEPRVNFISTDYQQNVSAPLAARFELDGRLILHKAVYNEIVMAYNGGRPLPVELSTFCDAPSGSGLGSSSTLVVVMLKAFAELLNLPLDDYTIARLAYRIERIDCGLQGGRQDQYAAAFGGFNYMEFYPGERAVINTLRIKNWIICELEASLVLFYTGVSRASAEIIADQSKNVASAIPTSLEAMHAMKEVAGSMKESLLKGDFASWVEAMREGWESKKRSAKSVSNSRIDEVYDAAIAAGALAGKVSGAGGGGYMIFFVPPDKRMDVIRALGPFDGQASNCHFTKHGAQAWRI